MSTGQRPTSQERERFPGLREDLGEDPAAFLDVPMFREGGGETPLRTAFARIRGIDSLETVNAWLAVERQLDRGPRDNVMAALRERRQFLEEHGERPEDFPTEEGPARYRAREVREGVECEYEWVDQEDGKQATVAGSGMRDSV
ncbi:hypothetical protein [Halobacterium hubeiense]|uniref:hypothetical protein n=1 Tax=Halobacterium hubeiense TaxID=1407499 RepID=UPI000B7CDCE0|nr:hypothetical protein [Halobacterium hubeiense]